MFRSISGYLEEVVRYGYRSSAISPLLWINSLIALPCLMLSCIVSSGLKWGFFSIAVCVIGYTLYKYNFLVNKDPRLVQSEKFQLESKKLDIIAKKGGDIIIDPVSLPITEEPKYLEHVKDSSGEKR